MNAEKSPLVSVVIPVFNGERHLAACLDSVLAQNFPDFEIVIAHQRSSDRSLSIIETFRDPRIRILPETEDIGLHSNWERAVAAAEGKYLKLVCQDDLLEPDCLSWQVDLLEGHPEAVIAGGKRRLIDDYDNILVRSRGLRGLLHPGRTVPISVGEVARACVRAGTNLLGEPAAVLVRRSALSSPAFDPRWSYAIDVDFYLRCLDRGGLLLSERVACGFRVSPAQLSAKLRWSQAAELRAFLFEVAANHREEVSALDLGLGLVRSQLLVFVRQTIYLALQARDRGFGRNHSSIRTPESR